MNFEPSVYNLRSPLLAQVLGVKDVRSIMNQLMVLGVKIRIRGKHKFVFTEDIKEALKDESENNSHIAYDERYKDFYK